MITTCKISKKTLRFFCGQSKTAGEKTCFEKRASRVVQLLIRYCTFSAVRFQLYVFSKSDKNATRNCRLFLLRRMRKSLFGKMGKILG